jgi:hypothetical protein
MFAKFALTAWFCGGGGGVTVRRGNLWAANPCIRELKP